MSELDKPLTAASNVSPPSAELGRDQPTGLIRLARNGFNNAFTRLDKGRLIVRDPYGRMTFGRLSDERELAAEAQIDDPSLYLDIARAGALGAADGYIHGKWSTSDLASLVHLFTMNRGVLLAFDDGWARLSKPLLRAGDWLARNTKRQSRRNIAAHYDIGNELFALFLDPTMMYSSAVYPDENSTLEEAAVYKLELICQKLKLTPEDHLLEIGTGWGGLAIHAARTRDCRVTTTTISRQQHEFATQRIRDAGLEHRVTLLDRDYRDLDGKFDKLVSVEMIEAVGANYFDTYFRHCNDLLRPTGRMLLQAIVMADRNYDRYLRRVDFIKKYIFPGGCLPSVAAMLDSIARVTDMQMVHLHEIGADYARTLRDWRQRFMGRLEDVRKLGYGDEFIRMWHYYLCYCESGFRERAIGDVQIIFDKPACRLPVEV